MYYPTNKAATEYAVSEHPPLAIATHCTASQDEATISERLSYLTQCMEKNHYTTYIEAKNML